MNFFVNITSRLTWGASASNAIRKEWPNPYDMHGEELTILKVSEIKTVPILLVSHKKFPLDHFKMKSYFVKAVLTPEEEEFNNNNNGDKFIVLNNEQKTWPLVFSTKDGNNIPLGLTSMWSGPNSLNGETVTFVKIVDDIYPYCLKESYYVYHDLFPDTPIPIEKKFLKRIRELKTIKECKCKVFLTGCICGVFAEEKNNKV